MTPNHQGLRKGVHDGSERVTVEAWVSKKVLSIGKIKIRKTVGNEPEPWMMILPHCDGEAVRYSSYYFRHWSVAFQTAMEIQDARNRGDLNLT